MNEKEMRNQPIAIIGVGCRFPGGASDPQAFWELLCQGTDAITDIPPDRWDMRRFYDPDPQKPGKTYVKQGGFLQEDISVFDPLFFGISPREASSLDPQQRLLLEVTWEAIEDAGLVVEKLSGSDTGVFIGAFTMDLLMIGSQGREYFNFWSATGLDMTILASRLSYVFDLKGPGLVINTACSSSLVATHYACQSLWQGECSLAIVGGVNLMLRPEYFILMSKGRFLSPTSRCMAFDERADGYTRGEGAGVVLLKPLFLALRDKDPIYALIRATGCNQDGKTPGIPFPSQESQEKLLIRVCQQAGIAPEVIQYVEAHGTGTKVGDPVEAHALHNVLTVGRAPDRKCVIGSVKTNIGHLEAAAGIAGLIKTALCLKHKTIPPHLHFQHPNPEIPFEDMCLRISTVLEPWPSHNGPAYAGVNSFGYGGTNAHVLLQEAPVRQDPDQGSPSNIVEIKNTGDPLLFPLSARSEQALRGLAGKYERFLRIRGNEIALKDFCYSAALRRSHHDHRATIVAESHEQLCEGLLSLASGKRRSGIACAQILPDTERQVVFVYTGMGPQWWAMGRELLQTEPVFRECLQTCDAIFTRYANWSLLDVFTVPEQASRIAETQVAQPANFALQTALTVLWKSWGIEPDAVVGHSVGEVTAAYVSGALSLEDALLVSYHRSRLQQTRAGIGTMLAAGLAEEQAQTLIQDYTGVVSIAAINSPSFTTLSGETPALQEIAHTLEERGVFVRFLHVEVAYHSPQMDGLENELRTVLSDLYPGETRLPLYSTVTGSLIQGTELQAEYWWRNVRQPVRFANVLKTLLEEDYGIFLEVGPHPVLQNSILESFRTAHVERVHLFSLYRGKSELPQLLESLGKLYALGMPVVWDTIIPKDGRYIPLPTYPWQRDMYWREPQWSKEDRLGNNGHLFLNTTIKSPFPAWEVELNNNFFPYLQDHRLAESIVFPAAAYIEAGLAVQNALFPQQAHILEQIRFHNFLFVDQKDPQMLHIHFDPQTRVYSIYSRFKQEEAAWTLHASGKFLSSNPPDSIPALNLTDIQKRCQQLFEIDKETYLTGKIHYGPFFQTVRKIWKGSDEVLGRLEGHESLAHNDDQHLLHPTLLDGGFQIFWAILDPYTPQTFIPVSIKQIVFYTSPPRTCWVYSQIIEQTESLLRGNVFLLDEKGQILVEVKDLTLKAISIHDPRQEALTEALYGFQWQQGENFESVPEALDSEPWFIFGEPEKGGTLIMNYLDAHHIDYTFVSSGEAYTKIDSQYYSIRPDSREDMQQLVGDIGQEKFGAILYLWSVEESFDANLPNLSDTTRHCTTLLHILQEFPQVKGAEKCSLGIVTCGSQAIAPEEPLVGLAATPLWGLGRVIRLEYPHLDCKLIDLDQIQNEAAIANLCQIFLSGAQELEIALRSETIFVNRLQKIALSNDWVVQEKRQTPTDVPVELEIGTPGKLDSLFYRESERITPGCGEIEIKVHTSALNFKDVLKVMGVIPQTVLKDTYFGDCFGMECSGKVVAIGEGVENFQVGDEVITTTNKGCFRSYITTPTTYVILKPATLRLEEAPMFTVFLTAYYALIHVARLQNGERVLIHNAAGGVGLSAVQVAQSVGAEIFATAGSPEKREFLHSLGIQYAMDSRTLTFAEEVEQYTEGKGVDVVLNAMSGEALLKSFQLLAPYGRFVEIGKKDIAENNGLPMGAFNRNLTFTAIDLDRMFRDRAHLGRQLFQEVYRGFEEGRFHALPVTVFPAAEAEQAFRYMARSKHIGKVMISMENQIVSTVPPLLQSQLIGEDATYLITGGTRGFGLEIAKWLAIKGAKHLVLISRSGALSAETTRVIKAMTDWGIQVVVRAVDVTDKDQVQQLFDTLEASLPPMRGIIHGAMVLHDGLLNGLHADNFTEVMAPKILGALHLHTCTQKIPLDFFVLLSSISSLTGNVGQASYAAANAFLDGFAGYRRSQGLPAMTVNWGALAQVGVAARNKNVQHLLESSGILGIHPEQAVRTLEFLLEHKPVQVAVVRIDWRKWSGMASKAANSPIFQQLIAETLSEQGSGGTEKKQELLNKLATLSRKARQEFLQTFLAEQLANAMEMPVSAIDIHKNILEFGVDSLMAVELSHTLQHEYGLELSAVDVFQGLSIACMATRLLEKLSPNIACTAASDELAKQYSGLLVNEERQELAENEFTQIARDAVLDSAIRPEGQAVHCAEPATILLTGATGFLGIHILHHLLNLTHANIYYLVRAENIAQARQRLKQSYANYFDQSGITERVIPLIGDLTKPLLGVSENEFMQISRNLDTIYHCGAQVNHFHNYATLRASNVDSTREILKLAAADHPKAVFYISSIVAAARDDMSEGAFEEFPGSTLPDMLRGYGYGQTKWVSEKLVQEAYQRGMGGSIFRPGYLSGRSDTGDWTTGYDLLLRMLKGCIQMGYAPDSDILLDITPVDFISEAIVKISLCEHIPGNIFHFTNPHKISWNQLIHWGREHGYSLELIPQAKWQKHYLPLLEKENTLFPVLPFITEKTDYDTLRQLGLSALTTFEVTQDNTLSMLETLNMRYPENDAQLWQRYFQAFVQAGFLPYP